MMLHNELEMNRINGQTQRKPKGTSPYCELWIVFEMNSLCVAAFI